MRDALLRLEAHGIAVGLGNCPDVRLDGTWRLCTIEHLETVRDIIEVRLAVGIRVRDARLIRDGIIEVRWHDAALAELHGRRERHVPRASSSWVHADSDEDRPLRGPWCCSSYVGRSCRVFCESPADDDLWGFRGDMVALYFMIRTSW